MGPLSPSPRCAATVFDSRQDKGREDLIAGLRRADMWTFLALHEIRQRYRRSFLGPLWITAVLGAQVGGMGLVYAGLLQQDVSRFLPYLAASLTVWAIIAGLLVEGANVFIYSAASIRSVVAPISTHVFRLLTQHVIIFAHNLLLVALVYIGFGYNPGWEVFLTIPGFVLLLLNLSWIVLLLGMAGARFRDIPLIVNSLILLLFIMTPVLWQPDMLSRSQFIVDLNPIYHLLEVVRGPLVGRPAGLFSWLGVGVSGVLGWTVAIAIYNRAHPRVPFWV